MLYKLIEIAVEKRLLVLLGLLATVVASILMLPRLNLDAFPDVTNVQVIINTEAEGLAAEEVEKLISYPVEFAMYTLPAVTEVRSLSRTGLSLVTVVFAEGTDFTLLASKCLNNCKRQKNLFLRVLVPLKLARIRRV
jgi:cobalt-zinc-cadmium resistance protein CzcA